MMVNLLQCPQRQRQSPPPILTRNHRAGSIFRRLQKGLDFGAEWFDILYFHDLRSHTGPPTVSRRRQTADRSVVRQVVNHYVIARLKETHLAYLLSSDTRG